MPSDNAVGEDVEIRAEFRGAAKGEPRVDGNGGYRGNKH